MSTLLARSALPALLLLATAPSGAVTLAAGIDDDFLAPADTVYPSAALTIVLNGYGGVQNYDLIPGVNGAKDRQVAHTFTGLAGLASGTLEIRVAAGTSNGGANDGIFLSFVEAGTDSYAEKIVWRRTFGAHVAVPPWYPVDDPGLVGATWEWGDVATIVLDLAALPEPDGSTLDLVALISQKGFLDVNISDDTAADYAVLEGVLVSTGAPALLGAAGNLRVFPNPFRVSTALTFSVRDSGPVSVAIYDVTGRPIRSDWRHDWGPGDHSIRWDGRDDRGRQVAAGVYWVRLQSATGSETGKVIHLR